MATINQVKRQTVEVYNENEMPSKLYGELGRFNPEFVNRTHTMQILDKIKKQEDKINMYHINEPRHFWPEKTDIMNEDIYYPREEIIIPNDLSEEQQEYYKSFKKNRQSKKETNSKEAFYQNNENFKLTDDILTSKNESRCFEQDIFYIILFFIIIMGFSVVYSGMAVMTEINSGEFTELNVEEIE